MSMHITCPCGKRVPSPGHPAVCTPNRELKRNIAIKASKRKAKSRRQHAA